MKVDDSRENAFEKEEGDNLFLTADFDELSQMYSAKLINFL